MRHLGTGLLAAALILAAAGPARAQRREERRRDTAPAVGSPAPDFHLAVLGSDERVRLSEVARTRPVVLIFGSYT